MQRNLFESHYYQRFLSEKDGAKITIPYFMASGDLVTIDNYIHIVESEIKKHTLGVTFTKIDMNRIEQKTSEYVKSRINSKLLETKFIHLEKGKFTDEEINSIQDDPQFESWGVK